MWGLTSQPIRHSDNCPNEVRSAQVGMMLQGVDRPNTTPIGQDRKFRDLRVLL